MANANSSSNVGPCRRGSHGAYILTHGNGAQHAIVILGNGQGLNLEDLAMAGQFQGPRPTRGLRLCLAVISIMWITLLITATGVQTDTWYLVAVGGIGMMHNLLVAGARQDPGALGVHLEFRDVVGRMETMEALIDLETKHARVGRCMLPIFFPGELLPQEKKRWHELDARAKQKDEEKTRLLAEQKLEHIVTESWTTHAKKYE